VFRFQAQNFFLTPDTWHLESELTPET